MSHDFSQATDRALRSATSDTEAAMVPQTVPVNVYETSGALVVVAPMPAVRAADVTVEVLDRSLRFWAHLRSAAPREYLVHEWDYGGYERELELPDGYGSALEATFSNGQLAVRVLRGDRVDQQIVPTELPSPSEATQPA